MGIVEGAWVGNLDGSRVGKAVGFKVGGMEGAKEILGANERVGTKLGIKLGPTVGANEKLGAVLGIKLGEVLGQPVSVCVGMKLGLAVGVSDRINELLGTEVGTNDGVPAFAFSASHITMKILTKIGAFIVECGVEFLAYMKIENRKARDKSNCFKNDFDSIILEEEQRCEAGKGIG